MLPWERHICQLNYQTTEVRVVNLFATICGDQRIKGFREKGKWNIGIKKLCSATLIELYNSFMFKFQPMVSFFATVNHAGRENRNQQRE